MMRKGNIKARWAALLLFVFIVACQSGPPKDCLTPSPQINADRQIQTRVYRTGDEASLLQAAMGVLQDSGFNIDQSASQCGLIVASRRRDVSEDGKIWSALILTLLTGIVLPLDSHQLVTASLTTRPVDSGQTAVRITFHHMVWDINGMLKLNETMREPEVYQTFYSKLSKSLFLDAHAI
ncbi:MAG: hypothetical protein QNJ01_14025 [Desulfobacterales bacterium]|nr:hypothetical protein [Desulfobacterales bacterium]